MILLIVLEPHYDRQHNLLAIGISTAVLIVHFALLAVYPFSRANYLAQMVKACSWASMASMLLLAFTCYPN